MRGMLAPLSPREENALGLIAIGARKGLAPKLLNRLKRLELIAEDGDELRLTDTGRRRYE